MRINVKYDKYEVSFIYVAKFQSPVAGTQMLLDMYLLKGKSNFLLSGLFYFSYKSKSHDTMWIMLFWHESGFL